MFDQAPQRSEPSACAGPRLDARDDDLAHVPLERIEHRIAELAASIYAGTCRWLELVAEFDRREGWGDWGCRSCAEWLSWRCAVAPRAAREHVRVARRLAELPLIHAAFASGSLSYSKVRALTRVEGRPDEEELLELARHATAAQLERIVRGYRRVTRRQAREMHDDAFLRWWWEEDGSLSIRGRIAPDDAAMVLRALDAARDALWEERRDEAEEAAAGGPAEPRAEAATPDDEDGSAEPPPRRPPPTNSEALVVMAETLLASGTTPARGGDRYQVSLQVDLASLAADETVDHCALDDGPALAPETARRLACDSSVIPTLVTEGGALSVGRRTRSIPPSLRRALERRDRGCRFPGCEHRRFVDAHHVRHWAQGGNTSLDNLLQLCRHHHRLLHEGGFSVARAADDRWLFRRADGTPLLAAPKLPPPRQRPSPWQVHGAPWAGSGERMDVGLAVDAALAAAGPWPAAPVGASIGRGA